MTMLGETIPRTNVLGVGICAFDMEQAVHALIDARSQGRRGYVCVTSVHGVIESQRDPELKRIHNQSLFTVPDGVPTVWMGREQGFVHMGRVYGPDLMLRVCEATEDRFTHFLFGATPETLNKLKANLEIKFPKIRIAGMYAPPFRPLNGDEESELREIVADCRPDFFWVGLSTPKQERFMAGHSPVASDESNMGHETETSKLQTEDFKPKFPLEAGIMLGVGAAFDIHAGDLKDAPAWIKNSGLQWFYRLCQEPRRLWRRYLDIVPTYLFLTALQLLGIKKHSRKG